jgi:hypothetical protein
MAGKSPEPSSGSLVLTETVNERLLRTSAATPKFLQGVFPFMGRGMFDLAPLDDALSYTVPFGKRARCVYLRAGNHSEDLVYLVLSANGKPLRYFPIGPRGDSMPGRRKARKGKPWRHWRQRPTAPTAPCNAA